MYIKEIALVILAILAVAVSYYIAVDTGADRKTVKVEPESHALMVTSNDGVLSKRILGMKQQDDKIYFVGYEGLGVYDLNENEVTMWPVAIRGNHREPVNPDKYYKGVRTVTIITSFEDFDASQQAAFMALFESTERGAQFYKPFYSSGYESSLIDMEDLFFITGSLRALKGVNHKLYVYDASGFYIINLDNKLIQAYFNNRISGEGTNGIPDSLKGHYGEAFMRIYALNSINREDLEILWSLRRQYLEKNHIDVQERGLFPLNLQDMEM